MYVYKNVHPRGLHTDDCVKRAITIVSGKEYREVSIELNRYKRITGEKSFNSGKNPELYVENVLHAKKILCKKAMRAEDFCVKHRIGRFILSMDGHWSCCVDGVIYDTWDTSEELVEYAYKIDTKTDISVPRDQIFRYACTAERISDTESRIRIYDGNGVFSERIIPTDLVRGYIRCLEDSYYTYVEIN